MLNWRGAPINECHEPLVLLGDFTHDRLIVRPRYFLRGVPGALTECYVRETVAAMLSRAAAILPSNYRLVVWDAYRPLHVQKRLFAEYLAELRSSHPNRSPDALLEMASEFVSAPSDDASCPSPHLTGGAVDLTIADSSGGCLNMGTDFDDFSPAARTAFYDALVASGRALSPDEKISQRNRMMLLSTMIGAGFSNYPEEWWHYDYGNQLWAASLGRHAIYGPAEPPTQTR